MACRPTVAACALTLLIGFACLDGAAGMDAPRAVIALPASDSEATPCGGSAILISRDGLALTLAEALPGAHPGEDRASQAAAQTVSVVLAGGRTRQADVLRRGTATTAVLLLIHNLPEDLSHPLEMADSSALQIGDTAWTAGNSFGAIEHDGIAAISRGVVSGLYAIPSDSPPVRGRGGRMLSDYRGPVIETDAAVNDGNQGGALLDGAGRVIGLVSLGTARERRLGTAVPIRAVLDDLGLATGIAAPARPADAPSLALAHGAALVAPSIALVYFERTGGIGNPEAVPRPNRLPTEVPEFERERLQNWWDEYYHQQQMFYTDQPVSALVIDAKAGLLLTACSNLHGDADHGRVLLPGAPAIPVSVVARHLPLDLALLKAEQPLPFPDAVLSDSPQLVIGERIGIVARHRLDAGFTLTSGMVSATARRRLQSTTIFAQTDAHANYGSLGGAVIDGAGKIVGMMVLLGPDEDRLQWAINSGVALFADSATVLRALPALIQGTSTTYASIVGLGVILGRPFDGHLTIIRVEPDTGAEAAGISAGDLLLKIDGHDIISVPLLARLLLTHREGDQVTVLVRRSGHDLSLPVVLRTFLERQE